MDENLIQLIIEELYSCKDYSLLDLIYTLLKESISEATAEPISA
jgi:hypothetical protein